MNRNGQSVRQGSQPGNLQVNGSAARLPRTTDPITGPAASPAAPLIDLDEVVRALLKELHRVFDVLGCAVWLADAQTNDLLCQQATMPRSRVFRGWRLHPGQGVAGWVFEHGVSLLLADAQTDSRHDHGLDQRTGIRTRSLLTVPLTVTGRSIGVLQLLDTRPGWFQPEDVQVVESLATIAALAIAAIRQGQPSAPEPAATSAEGEAAESHQEIARLHARVEELDAFAHTVAHNLKNPLAIIAGQSNVLIKFYDTMNDEKRQRLLQVISQSTYRLSNIVDELLLLAGIPYTDVETEPLDMAGIVATARDRLAHMIREHAAELSMPSVWPAALGYNPWVEEVWVNYLSNGVKYGGRPPKLELGATIKDDGMVYFWVRDNGAGLTPEAQAQLFTPFASMKQVRTDGHGLGLSIVHRIIQKLDGEVGLKSKPGAGSLFWFSLPAAPAPQQEHAHNHDDNPYEKQLAEAILFG